MRALNIIGHPFSCTSCQTDMQRVPQTVSTLTFLGKMEFWSARSKLDWIHDFHSIYYADDLMQYYCSSMTGTTSVVSVQNQRYTFFKMFSYISNINSFIRSHFISRRACCALQARAKKKQA